MNKRKKNILVTVIILVIMGLAYGMTNFYTGRDFVYVNQTDAPTEKVAIGENPVVNVTNSVEIKKGQDFNPRANLSVSDKEDGKIPNSKVKITNNVNPNEAGIYTVTYDVTDSDENRVKSLQTVIVNDGTLTIGNEYVMQAHDVEIRETDIPREKSNIFNEVGLKVYNKFTGEELKRRLVHIDNNNIQHKPGNYHVSFSYEDDVRKEISVKITDQKGTADKGESTKKFDTGTNYNY